MASAQRIAVSGGILAGGQGQRFGGADKGLLPYAGRPFVAHVLAALAPQVDDVTISANRNLERYAALGCAVVADREGEGPLAGMLRLLDAARHDWVVCVPCDALQLPADLVSSLRDAAERDAADIAVVREAGHTHPLPCLVRRSLAPDLREFLATGGTAVWRWQARHRLAQASLRQPFRNVNDAAALAALTGSAA